MRFGARPFLERQFVIAEGLGLFRVVFEIFAYHLFDGIAAFGRFAEIRRADRAVFVAVHLDFRERADGEISVIVGAVAFEVIPYAAFARGPVELAQVGFAVGRSVFFRVLQGRAGIKFADSLVGVGEVVCGYVKTLSPTVKAVYMLHWVSSLVSASLDVALAFVEALRRLAALLVSFAGAGGVWSLAGAALAAACISFGDSSRVIRAFARSSSTFRALFSFVSCRSWILLS